MLNGKFKVRRFESFVLKFKPHSREGLSKERGIRQGRPASGARSCKEEKPGGSGAATAGTIDVESKDYDSETPLSWAAEGRHAALVRQLEFHLPTSPLFTAFALGLDNLRWTGL